MRPCRWGQALCIGTKEALEIWALGTLGGSSLCYSHGGQQQQQLWYDARKAVLQAEDNEGLQEQDNQDTAATAAGGS